MTLTSTSKSTALAIIPKEKKTAKTAAPKESQATTPADGVDLKSFDGDAIPADDDGPGAGGGYKPKQDPVEGPGAGGGYDPDEIPDDDDGPGAGGGYETEQDPAESDGPGAGGGYFTEEGTALTVRGHWNKPLALFAADAYPHDIDVSTEYTPHWVQALPTDAFSWTTNTILEPILVDSKGHVIKPAAKKADENKKSEKKA